MRLLPAALVVTACLLGGALPAAAQEAEEPFVPEVGRPGKDVVWVPSPPEMVELMLDLAGITPQDYLIDLGSGDGRVVIAAARRGTPALGVEYSIKMFELARRNAEEAGVPDLARFVQGDMFEADISKATVLGLFLLPGNLSKLRDKFLTLAPGSRIVSNEYEIEGWEPDRRESVPGCNEQETTWCTALLYIVPARAQGTWQTPDGDLVLRQEYQVVSGSLSGEPVAGRLRGAEITFTSGNAQFAGRVNGTVIEGTVTRAGASSPWRATKR
jgi:hypothetical protein